MRTHLDLKALLARLPRCPTDQELEPVARRIAEAAATKRQPAKSLALLYRHHLQDHERLSARTRMRLMEAARRILAELRAQRDEEGGRISTLGGWLTLEEAARCYGELHPASFRARLKSWTFRRTLGWPWHDGVRWFFSPLALDPMHRAELMARLPARESYEPPEWYERQPGDSPSGEDA